MKIMSIGANVDRHTNQRLRRILKTAQFALSQLPKPTIKDMLMHVLKVLQTRIENCQLDQLKNHVSHGESIVSLCSFNHSSSSSSSSSPIDQTKNSSHSIPCRTGHVYCLKCLQRSMNEYIQSNTPPVCYSNLCDYELSRYDIECLPLQQDIIQRLLALVKTTQRPQCPLCHFYVDFNTMKDLEKHTASCNSENFIPCEYCHCLYNMQRSDEHSRQCRNDPPAQQQQALIDFILPRTKYPVTAQQLRVFLEHRKKNRLPLDPHAVVDALAEFGKFSPLVSIPRYLDSLNRWCLSI
jgi:hypothetical protein